MSVQRSVRDASEAVLVTAASVGPALVYVVYVVALI